ncbi:hypothetical protein N7492_001577 [Penicillium capsulatum]|uniref:Zn(2)-C6 fungal-type domain-containing protein n=1 Tax=Penicillium capsulatum TaxID=69766 RepID=A0A9W9IY12_9EURO|nr:hypothetical protein N7492_001577 [Penicillium capsulatum]KAJ6129371.1 hypothetical protein N7512_002151 [Penicillium capsulatum]
MAPKLFSRIFKRKREPPKPRLPSECSPLSIGISDSTCEINGDIFNRWKLPIPSPEQRVRKIGARDRNPQEQSIFFRLPAEIRTLIYLELMGDRRVHIRYVWKKPSPFGPQPIRGGPRWDWWHCVCDESNAFPKDCCFDHCGDWECEEEFKRKNPKINGVEWLRSCQIGYEEAVEVLYKTNVFAMKRALDTPFLLSRLIPPSCSSKIKSMDISLPIDPRGRGYNEDDWGSTYNAFFDLFNQTFHSVHRLRLELRMPPYEVCSDYFNEEWLEVLLGPFDRLSNGREWTQLQLCAPLDWRQRFEEFKEPMPYQAQWELTETMWTDRKPRDPLIPSIIDITDHAIKHCCLRGWVITNAMSSQAQSSSDHRPKPPRVLACALCQQRKVKCDRKVPCVHCVKLQVECVPVTNPRPRRRRFPERELLDRLRRYEGLLRQNKIEFDPLHKDEKQQDDRNESVDCQPPCAEVNSSRIASSELRTPQEPKTEPFGMPWDTDEDMRDTLIKNAWTKSYPNDNPVLFGARSEAIDISAAHPEPVHIFRLWQIYLNNVDPLLKVTHAPSLQPRILEAASNITSIDPTLEALMFSIYCASILSLAVDECLSIFGLGKEDLLAKYQFACQHALLNCGFLRSESRESLTALYLFLVSMYPGMDPRSLSSMLGIAMRIAQRIGIDDESSINRHSIFEAEMRRRLWWSLMLFDTRIGEVAAFKPTSLIPTWGCSVPWNLSDTDLRTEMKERPPQGQVTEAIFVVVRCHLADFLRHAPFHLDFTNPALKPIAKDETDLIIMEKRIEEDFLVFCDPENALHFMTMWSARGQISKCHLMRHYSKYSSSAAYQTQAHRDTIIFHALRMLECDTKMMTSPLTKGYRWFLQYYFPFPAYIFLLQELKFRPIDEQFQRAWEMMGDNCEARFSSAPLVQTPIFRMFAKVVLQAWDALEEIHRGSKTALTQPRMVSSIKNHMAETTQNEANDAVEQPSSVLPTAMSDFLTPPGFSLGSDNLMFGLGASTSLAVPDPGLFPVPGQPSSTAEMNHLNWVSMVWGLHQGRGW